MLYNINWDSIISNLPLADGKANTPDKKFYSNTDGRFNNMIETWKQAGYDQCDSVEWINYYPTQHFSEDVITNFGSWANATCARAWISRIRPGKMAPFHQDIDDQIETYLAQGELVRYSVLISKPSHGGIFLFYNKIYHLEPQGTVIKWDNYMDWHAGTNCGLTDKFMFHFLGVKNEK
jgi:hypothetical protein